MKMYSVKEISEMLDANPETVRRWIRAGKLKADQYSRKDGNMVQEDELYKYLRSTSKYAGIAAGMVASNSLLALTTIIGTGVTSILVSLLTRKSSKSEKDVRRLSADVERAIRANTLLIFDIFKTSHSYVLHIVFWKIKKTHSSSGY